MTARKSSTRKKPSQGARTDARVASEGAGSVKTAPSKARATRPTAGKATRTKRSAGKASRAKGSLGSGAPVKAKRGKGKGVAAGTAKSLAAGKAKTGSAGAVGKAGKAEVGGKSIDSIAAGQFIAGDQFSVDRDMLLTALPHPIFVLDRNQQFVYVSGAAEAFFETSTAMLKRKGFDHIVNFSSPLHTLVHQVLDTGCTVNEYAVEISTKRFDAAKLVDVYAGPIPERPELTVVMLLQRTMAQMIERQLTHRAAARSVSGMASVLAHEIKNPLSGIRGAAQLLEHNLSDEDRVLSRLICAETDRIHKLVDRMEVFGDERPIAKDPVNIHDVLEHVRRLAQAGFADGIQVAEEYDPSLPPVPGDRDQLIQAFLNLLKNAVEALRGDRASDRIVIRTAFRPGVRLSVPGSTTRISLPLMISIEDNGKGVPDHLKPHLFDPFVTTKTGGTGLGLALVAKIIGDHGGVIECESENDGTAFRVLLPLQPVQASSGKQAVANSRRNTTVKT